MCEEKHKQTHTFVFSDNNPIVEPLSSQMISATHISVSFQCKQYKHQFFFFKPSIHEGSIFWDKTVCMDSLR